MTAMAETAMITQVYQLFLRATAAIVGGSVPEAGGGWSFVLSDLKTLLETGKSLES